ncbi:MAG: 5'-methylthioadenosine/adenosylhomocysteine nucleosidase [Anaeroplasmataceae bacterium]|nr:5'-methylthioadenosine/adenosylhomocysteine nucleosidase [Anaeroplasmataceae bacterium]
MIGIIAAMKEEMQLLKDALGVEEAERICGIDFFVGNIAGKEIILSQCGVGKVNSSMAATILIDHFGVNFILNTGIAGGIRGLQPKDIILANSLMYHDVDVEAFGYAYGQVPGMPKQYIPSLEYILQIKRILQDLGYSYKEGIIYSGDSFVHHLDSLRKVDTSSLCATEMEGASIAQVCVKSSIDFVVLRYISDSVGHPSQIADYSSFESEMANRSAEICLEILKKLG